MDVIFWFRIIKQQRIITHNCMNLAIFLHSAKQYKDSTLPLPLAPMYSLPHQRWYFSSPSLTPLRKRKENTSLFKYIQESEATTQNQQSNEKQKRELQYKQFICVYQKNCYFDNRIKHMFDTIFFNLTQLGNEKQRIHCMGCSQHQQEGVRLFKSDSKTIAQLLQRSKKVMKKQASLSEQTNINWYQLTKNIIKEHLQIDSANIPQENIYIYKLPVGQTKNVQVFNILWNNNYLIFNNGNQLIINHHMKAKAIALCEILQKQLDALIWAKMQTYIEKQADEIADHQNYVKYIQNVIKINNFKVWFYKKQQNNQLYIINVSHITFKGIDCILYNHSGLQKPLIPQKTTNDQHAINKIIENSNSLEKDYERITQKYKTYSLHNKSNKNMKSLENKTDRNVIKYMTSTKHILNFVDKTFENDINSKNQALISDIQCQCCKDLLMGNQIVNQITAKHIQEIRYLRHMKIGKKQFGPYDFVKVCQQCYSVYLKHYKEFTKKREQSLREDRSKQLSLFQNKGEYTYIQHKAKQTEQKLNSGSSKRLLVKELNMRAKSQLHKSKENKEDIQISQQNVVSLNKQKSQSVKCKPPYLGCPPKQKNKKNMTNNTSNTQYTIQPKDDFLDRRIQMEELSLERSLTQQQNSVNVQPNIKILPKSSSFKSKNKTINTNNLINRLVFQQSRQDSIQQISLSRQDIGLNGKFNSKNQDFMMNAIDEYENIQRPSFKRLVMKNHRHYIKRQISKNDLFGNDGELPGRRKSIKSYN